MIRLYDGQITDLLRTNPIRKEAEVRALAYAILQEKRRLMDLVDQTRTMAAIDDLPERILDVLAVELRTPAYSEELPVKTKRALIKGTLAFYARLGTPWAVNWAIRTLFGNGHIDEWFEYGGEPHHFRVTVSNDGTFSSLGGLPDFMALIRSVKRLSSWLDDITVTTDMGDTSLRVGGLMAAAATIPMPEAEEPHSFTMELYAGGILAAAVTIPMPEASETPELTSSIYAGGTMAANAVVPIPEGPNQGEFTGEYRAGVTGAFMVNLPIPEQE